MSIFASKSRSRAIPLSGASQASFLTKTFGYLASSLAISTVCAIASIAMHLPAGLAIGMALGGLALMFILMFASESAFAAPILFLFSALEGLSLGPTLTHYLQAPNGPQAIAAALGATALAFFSLMIYTSRTKRDFSFLGGFLFTGLIVVLVMSVIGIFWHSAVFQLTIAGVSTLLFTGYLLFDLWRVWQGGESNPVLAAVALYLDLLNLFLSLARLFLAVFGGSSSRD